MGGKSEEGLVGFAHSQVYAQEMRAFATVLARKLPGRVLSLPGNTMASTAGRPVIRGVVFGERDEERRETQGAARPCGHPRALTPTPSPLAPFADMDGTMTIPCIDFVDMRTRIGVLEGDILAAVEAWADPARRAAAHAIIEEVELAGLDRLQFAPGLHEVLTSLDRRGVPRGLVTRNNARAVEVFHARLGPGVPPFAPSLARCFTPPKPDPAALHHIADAWGVASSDLVMVGDSLEDDVVAGNRAGAHTILIDHDGVHGDLDPTDLERRPTAVATSLAHAAELMEDLFDLEAPRPGVL